ncbi:hypothetical protein HDZ31DRAFT_66924 [Schizophyllum fasciatum]
MLHAALAVSVLFCTAHLPTARARPRSFAFNFTTVRECEPVSLTFPNVTADDFGIPTYLTLVPVNATPATIPLPNVGGNFLEGINITFLPLPKGTQFIASLDDTEENAVAYVTELLTVQPSDSSDGSCLPVVSNSIYTFSTAVTQCAGYEVGYNSSTDAPAVRAFSVGHAAQALNGTGDNGEATYIAAVAHGSQVIFMANNTLGQVQSSQLLTVLGDADTDSSCLADNAGDKEEEPEDEPETKHSLSSGAIIGLAVGGCIAGVVAVLMIVYFCRERRKRGESGRRRAQSILDPAEFYDRPNPSDLNTSTTNLVRNMSQRDLGHAASMSTIRPSIVVGTPSPDAYPRESYIPYVPPPIPSSPPRTPFTPPSSSSQPGSPSPMKVYPVKHNSEMLTGNEAFVMNPSYAFGSPPATPARQSFTRERAAALAVSSSPLAAPKAPSPQPSVGRRNMMQSLDIETMLNMASPPEDNPLQGSDASHDELAVAVVPSTPPAPSSAQPVSVISSPPRRGHFRPPSDVPRDPYASGLSAFDFANLSRPPSFASLASRRAHQRNGSVVSRVDSDVHDTSMLGVPRAF